MDGARFWTTKEKLAVASYAQRVGGKDLTGVDQMLETLSKDETSPHPFSAPQLESVVDLWDIVEPNQKVEYLTELRIGELKVELNRKREEYLKLQDECHLIESGAYDDKLDELIKKYECVDDPIRSNPGVKAATENSSDDIECQIISGSPQRKQQELPKSEFLSDQNASEESVQSIYEQDLVQDRETIEENSMPVTELSTASEKTGYVVYQPVDKIEEPTAAAEVYREVNTVVVNGVKSNALRNLEGNCSRKSVATPLSDTLQPCEPSGKSLKDAAAQGCDQLLDKLENVCIMATAVEESYPEEIYECDKSPGHELSCDEIVEENESMCGDVDTLGDSPYDTTSQMSPPIAEKCKTGERKSISKIHADFNQNANGKAWKKSIMILWKQIASHRNAPLFMQPVTDEIAPNYSSTMYRAMDLSTLKKNVENGAIRTTSEFQRDLMLMFQNAFIYNSKEHTVHKMAEEMQTDVMDQVSQFLATQIMAESTMSESVAQKICDPKEDLVFATSDILLSVLVSESRTKRVAAIEGEARFMRKKVPPGPPHEP